MKLEDVVVELRSMSAAQALSDLVGICGYHEVRTELDRIGERPTTLMGFPIHWTGKAGESEPFHILFADWGCWIVNPKDQGE